MRYLITYMSGFSPLAREAAEAADAASQMSGDRL